MKDNPWYLAGYFLILYYYYMDDNVAKQSNIMDAIVTCVEKYYPDNVDV